MSDTIESLIPHRAPMRWIDELLECSDTSATATTKFTSAHFAVTDGALLETALVECVAQTVAAALGRRLQASGNAGAANHGLLAAVSNFKILSPPPLDKTLRIEVHERKRFGPMLLVSGVVSCDGQVIASGDLSLYA